MSSSPTNSFSQDNGALQMSCTNVIQQQPLLASSAMHAMETTIPTNTSLEEKWVDMGVSNIRHPVLDDHIRTTFFSSPILSAEPVYSMLTPQPCTSQQSTQWPRMESTQASYIPIAPTPMQPKNLAQPTPRRHLTDEDRRQICLYHQDNPRAKQTEIGGGSLADIY